MNELPKKPKQRWICLTHEVFADTPENQHGGIAMPCEWVSKEAARDAIYQPAFREGGVLITGTRGDTLRIYDAIREWARGGFVVSDKMYIEYFEERAQKARMGASL